MTTRIDLTRAPRNCTEGHLFARQQLPDCFPRDIRLQEPRCSFPRQRIASQRRGRSVDHSCRAISSSREEISRMLGLCRLRIAPARTRVQTLRSVSSAGCRGHRTVNVLFARAIAAGPSVPYAKSIPRYNSCTGPARFRAAEMASLPRINRTPYNFSASSGTRVSSSLEGSFERRGPGKQLLPWCC
jgi:hypothetical protein